MIYKYADLEHYHLAVCRDDCGALCDFYLYDDRNRDLTLHLCYEDLIDILLQFLDGKNIEDELVCYTLGGLF